MTGNLGASPSPGRWNIQASQLVGPGFAHGRVLVDDGDLLIVWPAANDLYYARFPIPTGVVLHGGDPGTPVTPSLLRRTPGEVESAFAAEPDGQGGLRLSAVSTAVVPDDIPALEGNSLARTTRLSFTPTAPRVLEIEVLADEAVALLRWESVPGLIYAVQTSADLTRWDNVTEQMATETQSLLVIPTPRGAPARFYRLEAR